MQKMLGFTGTNVDESVAKQHEATATQFCEEMDDSLPQNAGKKINKKYKLYLPMARWVKQAAAVAQKQTVLKKLAKEVKEDNTALSIVSAQLKELSDTIGKGFEPGNVGVSEASSQTPQLVLTVTIKFMSLG